MKPKDMICEKCDQRRGNDCRLLGIFLPRGKIRKLCPRYLEHVVMAGEKRFEYRK